MADETPAWGVVDHVFLSVRRWPWPAFMALAAAGGALAALVVVSLGMFPFHLAQVAAAALLVIGEATASNREGGS